MRLPQLHQPCICGRTHTRCHRLSLGLAFLQTLGDASNYTNAYLQEKWVVCDHAFSSPLTTQLPVVPSAVL
jgi:hypothetical protein